MGNILFQMNSVTAPSGRELEPIRKIRNYFTLLGNMGRLGLQLAIEKKYGVKHFDGILNDETACEMYDDIIEGVMSPYDADLRFFHPQEIDAIAETLAGNKMTLSRCIEYLKTIIHSRMERLALEADCDGDTHVPTINWLSEQEPAQLPSS